MPWLRRASPRRFRARALLDRLVSPRPRRRAPSAGRRPPRGPAGAIRLKVLAAPTFEMGATFCHPTVSAGQNLQMGAYVFERKQRLAK